MPANPPSDDSLAARSAGRRPRQTVSRSRRSEPFDADPGPIDATQLEQGDDGANNDDAISRDASGDASGDAISGDGNSGNANKCDANKCDANSSDAPSGDANSRNAISGNTVSSDRISGDAISRNAVSGEANTCAANSGDGNSGDGKIGDAKIGDANSRDANSSAANSSDAQHDEADISGELSFREAQTALELSLAQLQSPELDVEEMAGLYRRASRYADRCEALLRLVEQEVMQWDPEQPQEPPRPLLD